MASMSLVPDFGTVVPVFVPSFRKNFEDRRSVHSGLAAFKVFWGPGATSAVSNHPFANHAIASIRNIFHGCQELLSPDQGEITPQRTAKGFQWKGASSKKSKTKKCPEQPFSTLFDNLRAGQENPEIVKGVSLAFSAQQLFWTIWSA